MRDGLRRAGRSAAPATDHRPATGSARRRRTLRRRRLLVGGVAGALALCLLGGGVAIAYRDGATGYRTATASVDAVDQAVDATGTVSSATRYDRSFSVAGTVGSVDVAVGDTVEAGQVLATMDAQSLQDAVDEAEQVVADAEQKLQDDIDSQTSSSSSSSSSSSGSSGSSGSTGSGSSGSASLPSGSSDASSGTASSGDSTQGSTDQGSTGQPGGSGGTTDPAVTEAVAAVQAAQQALLTQYQTVQDALAVSEAALTASEETCQAFLDATGTDDSGSEGATDEGATDSGSTGGGSTGGTIDGSTAENTSTDSTTAATDAASDTTEAGPAATAEAPATTAENVSSTATGVVTNALSTRQATIGTIAAAAGLTDDLVACQEAITAVSAAQTAVDEAQQQLMTAADTLDQAVAAAQQAISAAAASGSGTTSGGSSGSGTASGGSSATQPSTAGSGSSGTSTSGSGTSGSGSSSSSGSSDTAGSVASDASGSSGDAASGMSGTGASTVATAADLLADQAAIDQANAELTLAQSKLDLVDLTSPVSGTVAAVSIAEGDEVEASSTSAVITVIGTDGYTVSTTVPLSQIDLVEVGQEAAVSVSSTDQALTGTVTSVGILNTSSTSDPSYTVDLVIDTTGVTLFNGSSAQVSIAVAASEDTLTVPSSAVHLDGSTATVQVLRDGEVQDVEVERGAVGTELTEILSGIEEGDEVVLADLGLSVVSDDEDDDTSSGLSGLGESSGSGTDSGQLSPPDMSGFSGGQLPAMPGQ